MQHRVIARYRAGVVVGTLAVSLAFAQSGYEGPGRYEIKNVQTGKAMQVDRGAETAVFQGSTTGSDNQLWDIRPAPGGFVTIHNASSGRLLQLSRNANQSQMVLAPPDESNRGQLWRLEPGKDGNTMIVSSFGWTIGVPDGSSKEGQRLQVYDRNGEASQRFLLRRTGGIEPLPDPGRAGDTSRRSDEHNREPDRFGRFWDDHDKLWKLAGDGVCFYQKTRFRGDALCTRVGSDIGDAVRRFNGNFGSARLFGHAQEVEVFESPGFRGDSFRITKDEPDLNRVHGRDSFSFGVGSFRVD
jgi:hypothetical protein